MRSIKTATTLLLLLWTILAQAAVSPGYVITGTFDGLPNGTVLELIPSGTHNQEKAIASTILQNKRFSFKGAVSGPRLLQITVKGHNGGCLVMVENTSITISAKARFEESNGSKFLKVTDLKISGSPVHEVYLKKIAYRAELTAVYDGFHKRHEAVLKQIDQAYAEKDSVKVNNLKNAPAFKLYEADERAFFKRVNVTSDSVLAANKDSFWGPFLMLHSFSYFTPDQKPLFASLSKAAKESYYGQVVKAELFPKELTGAPAPVFSAMTNDKADVKLTELTKGHKYTLVDFWASWCVPCRKSIPALKALYKEFGNSGLQIVSISIDQKEADWLKAEKEEQFTWPSVLDKGTTANAWSIRSIPAMFLLDESGKVIAANVTLEQVRERLK